MIYSRTFNPSPTMCCPACVWKKGEHAPWCEKFTFMGMRVKIDPTMRPCEVGFELGEWPRICSYCGNHVCVARLHWSCYFCGASGPNSAPSKPGDPLKIPPATPCPNESQTDLSGYVNKCDPCGEWHLAYQK